MYKCSECQKEYEIKPDYCDDCGNDIFEEILIQNNISEVKPEPKVEIKEVEPQSKAKIEEPKKEFKPENLISYIIFGICIFLSIIVIFFINPKENDKEVVEKEEVKITNIPPLDSFWNNEAPKISNLNEKSVQKPQIQIEQPVQIQNIIKKIEPVISKPDIKVAQKTTSQQNQPKAQPVIKNNTKQTITQKQQVVQQTKPVSSAKNQNTKPVSSQKQTTQQQKTQPQTAKQQTTQQATQKQTATVWDTSSQAVSKTPVSTQQQNQNVQVQNNTQSKVNVLAQKKELNSYKVNLRNTIGRKIDFADVIGDGSCVISFKIDSNGKLINRTFSKQSDNLTLNNAVYKAVMQTPSYNPPPASYKGETLQLKITFYNGNFEINLN